MTSLFADIFPPATKEQWLKQVQKDLRDENVYDSLRWHTDDPNLLLEPYYTTEDMGNLPIAEIQSIQKATPGWLNTPEIQPANAKTANETARDSLNRGAEALLLSIASDTDIARLLMGIKLSDTPVYFRLSRQAPAVIKELARIAPYQLKGGLLTDPIASYLHTGTLLSDATFADIAEATRLTASSPNFLTICGSSHVFHNAGATATQELAFLLASLADQYDRLTDLGLQIDQLVSKTILSVSVGTSYFIEIAKLRALRVLWHRMVSAWADGVVSPAIHAQTSTFYDAAVAPYTNLLRATTEAMAAVVGGCDILTVHPYDTVLQASGEPESTAFSARIARNMSILLKEEAHLDKVADPSAGSYYIENVTQQLIDAAWTLFLQVEEMGGLLKAVAQGFVQERIEKAYQAKVDALQNGRIMVGVTKFRFDEPGIRPAIVPGNNGLLPDRRLAESVETNQEG